MHPTIIKDKIMEITLARISEPIDNNQLTQTTDKLKSYIENAGKDCLNSPDPVTGKHCCGKVNFSGPWKNT